MHKALRRLRTSELRATVLIPEHKAASEIPTRDEHVGLGTCEEDIQSVVCLEERVGTTEKLV